MKHNYLNNTQAEKAKKEGLKADQTQLGNSFDTDDFFEKAVNKTKKNKMKKED